MKSRSRWWLLWLLLCWLGSGVAFARSEAPLVLHLTASGPLTPSMAEYLDRGLRLAAQRQAEAVVLQLDTPGGSIDLMNRMVQSIRGSAVPVIVYVAPRGAMAGSAGTLITLAGHLAAMAPETVIGAAAPVGMQGEDIGQTLETKVKEALKATARSLAERRGPQAVALAEQTIQDARAVSAREALEASLIDVIAEDLGDLLQQADGRTVLVRGQPHILHTADALVEPLPPTLIEQLLQVLTNPNVVFLLLTVGVQALLIELANPGGWVPGFVGVVCLALAAYGMGVLPVNWFGLIFLLTAFVLFVLDVKAPTHGALTAAGTASFIIGALVLFNSPATPQFQRVSVPLVIATAFITAGMFFAILTFALRAQKAPVRTGTHRLTGAHGYSRSEIGVHRPGLAQIAGETWTAVLADGEAPIPPNTPIEVVAVEGLRVVVRRRGEPW